jgi:Calcineurin-like phosphoesterase
MKRRRFLKGLAAALAVTPIKSAFAQIQTEDRSMPQKVLKGFIISDAHYGWDGPIQPAPERQAKAMQTILHRFPDLDLIFDTGDAFHSVPDKPTGDLARLNWSATVTGGCKTLPFHYLAGNHDLSAIWPFDSEVRDGDFGSMPCRPYFSFDLKGVHFVGVPQLQDAVFVSRETMEWLKLDLELNKDRTVILLAHNNILGTTCLHGEPGYRGLVNGDEILALMAKYPNIIAWMNGHNHTYEVVKKDGYQVLFVSNGRFGGFVPPPLWASTGDNLGGIYFEVRPDKMEVRPYSADADKFLDEMGHPELSSELGTTTTVDPTAAAAYSYGVGGMCDGQKIPAYNHHTSSSGKSELFVTGTELPEINDDPIFKNYAYRDVGKLGNRWTLFSASVEYPAQFIKENTLWSWENPGFRVFAHAETNDTVDVNMPDYTLGKYEYYRVAPGNKYQVALDLDCGAGGGQKLDLAFIFSDEKGQQLATVPILTMELKPGRQVYEAHGQIGAFEHHESIYTSPASDKQVQLTTRSRFSKLTQDVKVHQISLMVADASQTTTDPEIILNGKSFAHRGEVRAGEIIRFDIPGASSTRDLYECKVGGSRRVVWLVRRSSLDYQVRNAAVADHGTYLEIGPLRNVWAPNQEIVIAPLAGTSEPYVHRLQNIQGARLYPLNRKNSKLKAEITACSDGARIIVSCKARPAQVSGATKWDFADSLLTIEVIQGAKIEIS